MPKEMTIDDLKKQAPQRALQMIEYYEKWDTAKEGQPYPEEQAIKNVVASLACSDIYVEAETIIDLKAQVLEMVGDDNA